MTAQERPPTDDELTAMAYVDGELAPEARAAFEVRLASERALALEVAQLRRLELIARRAAPPEPSELEWKRLNEEPLHRTGLGAGFVLTAVGVLGVLGLALYSVLAAGSIGLGWKLALSAAVLGLLALYLTVLRARLRVLPFDPYTEITR